MGRVAPNPRAPAGRVNRIGLWTLYRREVRRFLKVAAQTVTGPVVTTLLFLAVFAVVMARRGSPAGGEVSYLAFLAPGLVMMALAQNAFANSASSLLIAKVQGNIADVLMAPLTPAEIVAGFALGGVTRGLVVGAAVAVAMAPFVSLGFANPGFLAFHALAAALMLSLMGILAGLWAEKMDHLGAMTSFAVAPMTFLSGTFYSIAELPLTFRLAVRLNPFFYMIDGFRYGAIGHADASPALGVAVMIAVDLLLAALCHRAVAAGWRLRR